jgi:regulator of replication initiation timing
MIKHVGKHAGKKIVILFREVPNEDHMCLVAYSETLPRLLHDEVMKVLESPSGQQSQNLADALFRNVMQDGANCLESLHKSGYIKKIACNQVLVTPNSTSSVKLDELNRILNEMAKGKDAKQRLAELDKQSPTTAVTESSGILSDHDLAQQRIAQAENMKADAARLLKEAEALLAEAATLDPSLNEPAAKKTKTKTIRSKKD